MQGHRLDLGVIQLYSTTLLLGPCLLQGLLSSTEEYQVLLASTVLYHLVTTFALQQIIVVSQGSTANHQLRKSPLCLFPRLPILQGWSLGRLGGAGATSYSKKNLHPRPSPLLATFRFAEERQVSLGHIWPLLQPSWSEVSRDFFP